MISFESDYTTGAHPDILKRLTETNYEFLSGYGTDHYCESAREKIRIACDCKDADVHLLVGGTQTNALVISAMLHDYEGVIAADTGHVSVHEAGAIEYTGHKVLTLPHYEGKLMAVDLKEYLFVLNEGIANITFCTSALIIFFALSAAVRTAFVTSSGSVTLS
jgi:threonine aldolase